jgi:tyrosine-protein kinase Etk/Wzc
MEANNQLLGQNEIRKILTIIRKNWWIVVIFGGIAAAIGSFVAYKQTSVYSVGTQILLKTNDEFNQSSVISDNGGGNFYGNTYKTFVDNSNEKRIITSFDLIKATIQRLDFNVSYFIVGRIKTQEVFQKVPFHVKVKAMRDQFHEMPISMKIMDGRTYRISYKKGANDIVINGTFGKVISNSDMELLIDKTNYFSPKSTKLVQMGDYQFLVHNTDNLVYQYKNTMTVENPNYTNVLQINVEDVLPERGVMFLDTLTEVYIENSIQARLEVNANTVYYINKQKADVEEILNHIEDSLQGFREDNAIINLEKEGDEYFRQYMTFDNSKRMLQLQISALDMLTKYIIENQDSLFMPPSAYLAFDDPFLSKSAEKLYQLQSEYNHLLNTVTEKNFGVTLIKQSIDSLKSNMVVYIRNNREAILNRIEDVNSEKDTSKLNIRAIPLKQRGLINIDRQRKVNEDLYNFLLRQRASTIIAKGSIVPLTKIIEKARPAGIVRPDKNKMIYIFLGIGLLFALVIIAIRVMYYDRIESYEELKAATSLPIVGEIVRSPTLNELKVVVEHEPKSPISESFRTIRTNLQYMLADKMGGVIIVTSNNPGEGKTFCSINLAAIIAKGGKRVVLMELDLHKPRVQKGLAMEGTTGVSTYVIGKNTIQEILVPSPYENLDVVLSGPIPPNPSEIVVSKKMEELIAYCKANYDFVIIDTPPVGLITDALVLMKAADVTLFVLNTKIAYRHSLNNAHEIVSLNKLTHFGFILNGVKQKRSKYYYNRYGYGYTYGYGGGYGSYGSGYGSYGSYGNEPRPKGKTPKK